MEKFYQTASAIDWSGWANFERRGLSSLASLWSLLALRGCEAQLQVLDRQSVYSWCLEFVYRYSEEGAGHGSPSWFSTSVNLSFWNFYYSLFLIWKIRSWIPLHIVERILIQEASWESEALGYDQANRWSVPWGMQGLEEKMAEICLGGCFGA